MQPDHFDPVQLVRWKYVESKLRKIGWKLCCSRNLQWLGVRAGRPSDKQFNPLNSLRQLVSDQRLFRLHSIHLYVDSESNILKLMFFLLKELYVSQAPYFMYYIICGSYIAS